MVKAKGDTASCHGLLEKGCSQDENTPLESSPLLPGDKGGFYAMESQPRRPLLLRAWRLSLLFLAFVTFFSVGLHLHSRPTFSIGDDVRIQGLAHRFGSGIDATLGHEIFDARTRPQDLANDTRVMHEIPQYVLDYAPLVHLYSEEQFWPCDIAEHLFHITPELNYTPIQGGLHYSNLTNLDRLNRFEKGRHVYLTSNDNVEERPDWLGGQKNIPDEFDGGEGGDKSRKRKSGSQSKGGRSDAPAVLVTVNKGNGIVDAFWFYFYSYNLGNLVFNIRFGNHVGDWEHSLIRFQHGKPRLVYFGEHNFGSAYSYSAVEKIGKRPVVYSATGTHAMYAMPGSHPYVLPLGILHDQTDRGPLWDPALNSHKYTYNHLNDTLRASNFTPSAPTEWFYFAGRWGDKYYPLDDDRQYGQFGEYHYVSGPFGPRFKHLGRRKVCQGLYTDPCVIKNWLPPSGVIDEIREWPGLGKGEDKDWPDWPEVEP